ncbi:MAG: hypothetical protein ACKV2V_28125 [Blastocatellia bacterium]
MRENRVSAALSAEDREFIFSSLAAIRARMPFLIDLTTAERRALTKLGDKSYAFAFNALEHATQNQDMLPRKFDLEEMNRDLTLFEDLRGMLNIINQWQHLMQDTMMQVGSEGYAAARQVYGYAVAGSDDDGLEEIATSLGQRYARKPGGRRDLQETEK